jgi:catechol 2,3-dioxygenase-like lactoylglutathione lyase family enzyme
MFSHVMVGAQDTEQSKAFYDATLAILGHEPGIRDEKGRYFYRSKSGVFGIGKPIDGNPASHANGGTIGFLASSPELVDQWHAAGLAAGGTAIENPPGLRENAGRKLYLAYLRDPAGNKLCALHRVIE